MDRECSLSDSSSDSNLGYIYDEDYGTNKMSNKTEQEYRYPMANMAIEQGVDKKEGRRRSRKTSDMNQNRPPD